MRGNLIKMPEPPAPGYALRPCAGAFDFQRNLTTNHSATVVALMKTEIVAMLKRQATRLIAELQEDRDPVLISERGRPAAYLVHVDGNDA